MIQYKWESNDSKIEWEKIIWNKKQFQPETVTSNAYLNT